MGCCASELRMQGGGYDSSGQRALQREKIKTSSKYEGAPNAG